MSRKEEIERLIRLLTPTYRRIKYMVACDGRKFPFYNQEYNIHPNGTKRYANIGNNHREPQCHDLPHDGYPYSVEYENNDSLWVRRLKKELEELEK